MISVIPSPAEPPKDPSLLLTKAKLAEHFAVSERQIDLLVKAGELPSPIRVGQSPRWCRAAIVDWIQKQQEPPAGN